MVVRPRRRRRSDSRGQAVPEFVVVTPLLLLMVMAVVQFALWQHGTHVAEAAAQEGCSSARVQGGTNAAGVTEAQHILTVIGGSLLVQPAVNVSRQAGTVTVRVAATAEQVVPMLQLPITATCSAPAEPALAAAP